MEYCRWIVMGISTVIYVAAGILTVLPVPETSASPLIGNSDVNRRSVSCLSGEFYNAAIGGCQACITCGKGEFFNDDCYGTSGPGTCSPCDRGYYQSKDSHADDTCSTCKHCQHRVRIRKCTRTENAICGDCLPGYYEKTVFTRKMCMKCPTKGNLPKPCKQKPTTTTVPPVPHTPTTPPPSTTPTLPTTSPDTSSSILVTTPSETPIPSTTPLQSSISSFNDLTTTPAMNTDTEIPTSRIIDPAEVVGSGPLDSYGLWVVIIAVSLLIMVLLGGVFCSKRCKVTSSSVGYVSPGNDTQERVTSHAEEGEVNDEAGNYEGLNERNRENIAMMLLARRSGNYSDSVDSTPSSSSISTPRDSMSLDGNSELSYVPSFESINKPEDYPQERESHIPDARDLHRGVLANICLQLDGHVSKDLFEDFKTYCQLRETLDIRTLEGSTSFSNCVNSLIQQNDLAPGAVATFLCSFFANKNQRRCCNIIKEKFPHVSSEDKTFTNEDVFPSNIPQSSKGDGCDWTYYYKIEKCLEKHGVLDSLKLQDISTIVDGIDSILEKEVTGIGSMFAIAIALKVKPEVANSLKRYQSLENFLSMSKPDLTVREFVYILTLHNRIAAVKMIYEKLSCDRTMKDLKRRTFNGQTCAESRSERWNML